jgi:uncharacterized membrane protein YphA (DoxX/SURF4 family)
MFRKSIGDQRDFALFIIRIVIGVIFLLHGIQKLQGGVDGVAGFLGSLGLPAPVFFAWILTLVETLGGIALILGLFTELAAILLGIVMIVAIWKVKSAVGIIAPGGATPPTGMELDLALLAGLASLLLQGAGRFSVDMLTRRRK